MGTVWYVKPRTGITSEQIGVLSGDEDTCYDVLCADGRKRDMYRVPWARIQQARDRGEPLRFTVWKQEGTSLPTYFDLRTFSGRRFRGKIHKAREQLVTQLMRKAAQE